MLGVELVFMLAVILGVLLGAHTHEKRSMIVGILCVFFGSIMYFSPLTIMVRMSSFPFSHLYLLQVITNFLSYTVINAHGNVVDYLWIMIWLDVRSEVISNSKYADYVILRLLICMD